MCLLPCLDAGFTFFDKELIFHTFEEKGNNRMEKALDGVTILFGAKHTLRRLKSINRHNFVTKGCFLS